VTARDQAIAAIRARLGRATGADGDPAIVLEESALAEAASLAETATDNIDVEASYYLGSLHILRYELLAEGEDEADGQAALLWFSRVLPSRPDLVPARLFQTLAPTTPPAGATPDAWHNEALCLLSDTRLAFNPHALDRAIWLLGDAVAGTRGDKANRAVALGDLSTALRMRFERVGAMADLDRAILTADQAVAATAADDRDLAARLSELNTALRLRFEHTGTIGDLDRAVAAGEQATSSSREHPSRARHLANYAVVLILRFEYLDQMPDLDRAITIVREAVATTPPRHSDRARRLTILGGALIRRFQRTGTMADLDQAVDAARLAVTATPSDDLDRAAYLSNLGNALHARFERTGSLTDLDDAVDVGQDAVLATPDDHPNLAMRLSNLANALTSRFEHSASLADIDRAISLHEQAVVLTPRNRPNKATHLTNLGNALRARFDYTGETRDLDRAIEAGGQALAFALADQPGRALLLSNQGTVLRLRFEREGGLTDLDEAIDACRQAVDATAIDHPDRALFLDNLGSALARRFERTLDEADLEEAIRTGGLAVTATPENHSGRAGRLNNLGTALTTRFQHMRNLADLDNAVRMGEEAVRAVAVGHPDRAMYLSNLGAALTIRYGQTAARVDLDAAIDVNQQAVDATPFGHPTRTAHLVNLGTALRTRFERTGDVADGDAAVDAYRQAATEHPSAAPLARARAAQAWATFCAHLGDWPQAHEAYMLILDDLIPQVTGRGLDAVDRQHHLAVLSGLGSGAATSVIAQRKMAADEPTIGDNAATRSVEAAWAVLDQGRGIIVGQALEMNLDSDLRQQYPELAQRADALLAILNGTDGQSATAIGVGANRGYDVTATSRRTAAAQWKQLVADIRARPGFERYALAPTLEQLRVAVADGTAVAITVTPWRCDALVMTANATDHLRLPDLAMDDLVSHANAFLEAVYRPSRAGNRDILRILAWLWDTVIGPVLDHLSYVHSPELGEQWPYIWWMPNGPLSVLPLHAAGHHHDPLASRRRRATLDRVISSYAPTLRTLARARRRLIQGAADANSHKSLVVGIDEVDSTAYPQPLPPPLHYAVNEAKWVHAYLANAAASDRHGVDDGMPLLNDAATIRAVRDRITRASFTHLACHGVTSPDPSSSYLALYDGPLPVRDLTTLRLSSSYFAYVSACTSAFGGTTLLDENIHIASALHVAGYPHVIAALWPVNDYYAATMTKDIYTRLAAGQSPPEALHRSQRQCRNQQPSHPYLWAPYMHFGP